MILLLVGIFMCALVCIMIMALFASAKGEDKLRETSYQHYHS